MIECSAVLHFLEDSRNEFFVDELFRKFAAFLESVHDLQVRLADFLVHDETRFSRL